MAVTMDPEPETRQDEVTLVVKVTVPREWTLVDINGGYGWRRPDGVLFVPWLMVEQQGPGEEDYIELDWKEIGDAGIQIDDYTTHEITAGAED